MESIMESITGEIIDKINTQPSFYARQLTIKELENLLRNLSDIYYNTGDSAVSDDKFDIMKEVLEERDPKNKFLKEIGAEISKDKVKLPFPMGSMNKIKPTSDDLEKWIKKYSGDYLLSDKLDGISAQIYKDKKGIVKMYSRGNGFEGQDITHLIKYVVDEKAISSLPKDTSIRGELIMTEENFKLISDRMKNARNAVAGLVNSKVIDTKIAELTELITYNIIHPTYKQIEQYNKLQEWDFKVVTHKLISELTNNLLNEYLIKRRKESPFAIDGIIVNDNSKAYKNKEGNPEHAFAFKAVLEDQIATTEVLDVLWKVSKDGYIKPTITIKPVELVGVTVSKATAFNAKYIQDNKLGKGAIIEIIRSGDVIPYISKVIKPATKASMPDIPFVWNETEVDIIVKDKKGEYSDDIIIQQLVYFFSKLDIKHISEGIITKLVDAGYNSLEKILKAKKEDLVDIDGIGSKLIDKIFTNIEDSFGEMELHIFMAASGAFGRGLGERKIKEILKKYPDIMNKKWSKNEMIENILTVDGFSDKLANKFAENFSDFVKFYDKVNSIYDISHLKKHKNEVKKEKDNKFENQIIVMTGFRNKEWKNIIESQGGKTTDSVSSKTTLVIRADDEEESTKINKAKSLGIKIITKSEFEKKYSV